MPSITSLNSAALLILQRPAPLSSRAEGQAAPADLTALANGRLDQASGVARQLQSTLAEDMFSVNSPNLNRLKIDLFERVGKALGIERSDFDSVSAYGSAIKSAVEQLKRAPDGALMLRAIEKEAGLDKLGVSLDTVIEAMIDPSGDDNEKLEAALQKHAGEDASAPTALLVQLDEIGLYDVSNA